MAGCLSRWYLIFFLLLVAAILICGAAMNDFSKSKAASFMVFPGSLIDIEMVNGDRSSSGRLSPGDSSKASTSSRSAQSSSSLSSSEDALVSSSVTVVGNESQEGTSECPASCFRANPVCGVDGVTYWCGFADAQCSGVEVEYVGFCDFGSKGTGGRGILAVQSLLLVHMIWLMLAACLVLLGVP